MSTMSTLAVERWEARVEKQSGRMVITFDGPDDFQPAGDEVVVTVNRKSGVLELAWARGGRARLLDGGRLADVLVAAPEIDVRWTADGLFRGASVRF